jgi:hypothetical protein
MKEPGAVIMAEHFLSRLMPTDRLLQVSGTIIPFCRRSAGGPVFNQIKKKNEPR